MENKQPNIIVRILALLLITGGLGGICGEGLNVWSDYTGLKQQSIAVLIETAVIVFVYFWTMLKGMDLWRGLIRGYKWAKILFAAQIPVIVMSSLSYGFYTGIGLDLVAGHVNSHVQFHIDSGVTLYIDPSIKFHFFGVNLVAIVALVYLAVMTRTNTKSN